MAHCQLEEFRNGAWLHVANFHRRADVISHLRDLKRHGVYYGPYRYTIINAQGYPMKRINNISLKPTN